MNWDALIDNLAFGRTAPKAGSTLGMFLSPETIYIAQTSLGKSGQVVMDHLVRIPVPVPEHAAKGSGSATGGTATLNTSFLTENQKLGTLIRQSMSQYRWNSKRVMVTLSHHLGLLRYFIMPSIERRFLKSAVPVEAKKYIPIPFDLLGYDYQCAQLPAAAGGRPRLGVLVAVTQRQNLANIAAMLEGLGLTIAGMEVAPCSALKLWQALDKGALRGTYCQVHFDGGSVRILIADQGFPVFFREVFLGEEAEIAEQRKLDLGGCLMFAQKQLAVRSVGKVYVSGTSRNLQSWKEAFGRELGLPVDIQDIAGLLRINGGDWGGYAAVGASLRFQVSSPITLDLGAVGRVTEDERKAARGILIAGGLLTLFFLFLGFFKMATYQYRAREARKFKSDPVIEDVLRGKSENAIVQMFQKMEEQADVTLGLCNADRPRMMAVFKDLVDSLPERAWLNRITIGLPFGKEGAGNSSLALAGHAHSEDTAREQDMASQFKERLAKTAVLGKLFPILKVTIHSDTSLAQADAALSPDGWSDKMASRTDFTITGGSR